jgi:peptidyl-prolyl cis-trans isomerase C
MSLKASLIRVLKEPLFHFVLIGAAIYGAYAVVGTGDEAADERAVTITAGEVKWMTDNWTSRWNRPPTREELDGVLRAYIKEQVLAKEAVAMGLDEGDTIIQRRLAQKLEFLSKDLLTPTDPDPQVLAEWFELNKDRYRDPVLYTMTHIYLDPDSRDVQALEEAEAIRDELNELEGVPADLNEYGDPFMLQSYYPEHTEVELAKSFGSGFVEAVKELEPGRWHAPVLSGYGVHVVLLSERRLPEEPVFAEVEDRVRQDWTDETRDELNEQFIANLLDRYEVNVEETSVVLLDTEAARAAAQQADSEEG